METSLISPMKENNTAQPQQREENTQQNLNAAVPIKQQSPGLLPEALEVGVKPDPASQILSTQEIENPVAGFEGDSDKFHISTDEMAEHLQASDLWYCPDGSFVKKIIVHGHGLDKPKLGSKCRVLALGFPFGSGMPEGWTELTIGTGQWREKTWGELTEKCLESMRQGEEAKIHLPGSSTPLAKLRLDSFTNGRDSWELEAVEKEALAKEEHRRGTELFRAGNPQGAARCYGRALRLLLTLPPPGPPERTILHANLAACQLLLGHPQLAAQSCDRVLEREPGHLKALYRRGVAQAALGDLDKATADLKKVLAVDPKNRAAKEELGKVVIQGKIQDAGLARVEVLHSLPAVRQYLFSLYECRYSVFFQSLAVVEQEMKKDWLFAPHYRYYVREMRIHAYSQLLESYRSLTLGYMAEAFGVGVEFIDQELSRFIAAGRLHCKIDKVNEIVETNRPDSKNWQYQETIKKGDLLLNRVQKLSRVINM